MEEVTRERDELDDVIDRCNMINTTGKSREDKLRFKQLTKTLQDAQKCAKRTTLGLYKHEQANDFAEDCDWWYNMIRLLADRTGEDELKTLQVINWLTTMPSVLGMFDVKKRDFKKIKL
jgi:hypothetical protein